VFTPLYCEGVYRPIFSNGHISRVTDDISLELLPSNLQLQSGHMPAHALSGQLLASNSGCASSAMRPLPLPLSPAHRHTMRQWEFLPPPSSPSPSNFPSISPTDLKSPFSSPSRALSTRRRNHPDSFYGCRNSTIFQAATFGSRAPPLLASPPINQQPFHPQRPPESTRQSILQR
jgi:hypothetical protein